MEQKSWSWKDLSSLKIKLKGFKIKVQIIQKINGLKIKKSKSN